MLTKYLSYKQLFMRLILLVITMGSPLLWAEHPDLAFYVVQKYAIHEQDASGKISVLGYYYNGEVFKQPGGTIVHATFSGPGESGRQYELEERSYLLVAGGGPLKSLAEVDAAFPNGPYRFDIVTAHGDISNRVIMLAGKEGKTDIAAAPKLRLYQNGKRVAAAAINADIDFLIEWTPFSIGAADANEILDDLVTVVTEDCHGKVVNRTPLPFYGDEPAFTFRDAQHVVAAGTLKPGQTYTSRVEHINIVYSNDYMGIPELASYGSVTNLGIQTRGKGAKKDCP